MKAWHDGTKYADRYLCHCPLSDGYRCGRAQRLATLVCHCTCHRYADDERDRQEAAKKANKTGG